MSVLTGPFEHRSVENPSVPITASALADLLSGLPASSGVQVTERTAMNYSALWAVVGVLASSVASLPCILYRRSADGRGKSRASDERLYGLLHDSPNEQMTATVFWETAMAHLANWGNAYAFIEEDASGEPQALWPLLPDRTRPVRKGRGLFYNTWDDRDGGRMITLYPEQVYHVPGLGFDGLAGYSPIAMAAREPIGLGLALERFGGSFFSNGTHLSGVLSHPGKLSPEAIKNLRESWMQVHSGPDRQWKPAILSEGLTWTTTGVEPNAAQFIESRRFQVEEIARIYRVPLHKLANLDKATFSNIEHQSLEFVMDTLRPWLIKLEQEANRKLIRRERRGELFVEFLIDGMLRGDMKSRSEAYKIGKEGGWLSTNEIRAMENMNPVSGGDEYKSLAEIQNQKAAAASDSRRWIEPTVRDACGRLARRSFKALSRHGADAAAVAEDCRRAGWDYLSPSVTSAALACLGRELTADEARSVRRAIDEEITLTVKAQADGLGDEAASSGALGGGVLRILTDTLAKGQDHEER